MTAAVEEIITEPALLAELEGYTVPAPEPEPVPDPEAAARGLTKEGRPRRKPGPKPGAGKVPPAAKAASARAPRASRSSSTTRPTSPRPPSAPTSKPAALATGAPTASERLKGARTWTALPEQILMMLAVQRDDSRLIADAAVCSTLAEPAAVALAAYAAKGGRLGSVLDRVLVQGEKVGLGALLVQGAAQIAANHGYIPAGSIIGRMMNVSDPTALAEAQIARYAAKAA